MIAKQPKPEKIIMGIDPGTNLMGYAILRTQGNKAEMMAFGIIELKKYASHYLKLGKIFENSSQFTLPQQTPSFSSEHRAL